MQRYLVLTMRTPGFDPAVVAGHYAFLDRLKGDGVLELAGPFGDKSGGAYIVKAETLAQAEALAFQDPVHTSGSSVVTVKEWHAK